jgi:Rrf2 family protein
MMELTRRGEYAIRGVVWLAQRPAGELSLLGDIAAGTEVPAAFMAKILQDFVRLGIVRSARGANGGFALARPAGAITLREVVEAVEGPIMPNRCLLGKGVCDRDSVCRVHPVWRKVQSQVHAILESVTLAELASQGGYPGRASQGK